MAGNKLSPRQKMINLMYLVFIAMLALTMSKKVLTSFGRVFEDLKVQVQLTNKKNADQLAVLGQKAQEQAKKYGQMYQDAQALNQATLDFEKYMDNFEKELLIKSKQLTPADKNKPIDFSKIDYETLDKGFVLDDIFFKGEGYTKKGQEFLDKINNFRKTLIDYAKKYNNTEAIKRIERRFDTKDKKVKGSVYKWLYYNFEDFPLIASLTNMARLEANAAESTNEILSSMLQGKLISDVSMKNYQALVLLDKSAFFPTEHVTGKVVLGRYDQSLQFEKAKINDQEVPEDKMQNGQVLIDIPAGNPGDKTLSGMLEFKEGDSIVQLPFEYKYSVIPMPNSAVISADKMNVVYKGVKNPLSISVPGIPDNKVKVSAPAQLRKVKSGKYELDVSNYRGRTIDINVSWVLPNGQRKSDKKTFRVKNIPRPVGTILGSDGYVKLPKRNIQIGTIGAALPDFDFDVKVIVTSFDFKAPGQPTIRVNGTRLNQRAINALRKVKRGQTVQIINIKARLAGSSIKLQKVTPIIIEIQ